MKTPKTIFKALLIILGTIFIMLLPFIISCVKMLLTQESGEVSMNYDAGPLLTIYFFGLIAVRACKGIKGAKTTYDPNMHDKQKAHVKFRGEIKADIEARREYLASLDTQTLRSEPFTMQINDITEVMGMLILNGPVESGILEFNRRSRHDALTSQIYVEIPLLNGTRETVKVEQIGIEEDEHGEFNIAAKGDHISLMFLKGNFSYEDIQRYGTITQS